MDLQILIDMNADTLARKIVAYMEARGYELCRDFDAVNIVYLEGSDITGDPNPDRPDEWNDLRIALMFDPTGAPEIELIDKATTEPGLAATLSEAAKRRGGCARIAIGQHKGWRVGFHKKPTHPALVQVLPIPVHRDYNCDHKRTGDRVLVGLFGINQHGTRRGVRATRVGTWSEGCLVGQSWDTHERFIILCRQDPRYLADKDFIFSATIIDGDDFGRFPFTV